MSGVDELLKADAAAILQMLDEATPTGEQYPGQTERYVEQAVGRYRKLTENYDETTALYVVLGSYALDAEPDVVVAAVARALYRAEREARDARLAARGGGS